MSVAMTFSSKLPSLILIENLIICSTLHLANKAIEIQVLIPAKLRPANTRAKYNKEQISKAM